MNKMDKIGQELAASELNMAHKLSHEQFKEGIKSHTLEYQLVGEPSDFLDDTGSSKKMFRFWVAFYWISPIIVIPMTVFFIGNWWLLFGVLFSFFGNITAPTKISILVVLYCIGEAISGHWHFKDYDDFFAICMIWGTFWYWVADQAQKSYADIDLTNKPELYYLAVEKNRIIVTLK